MTGNIDCTLALCSGQRVRSGNSLLRSLAIGVVVLMSACSIFPHPAATPTATPRLNEATIRAFVAEEEAAWNARDFDHYYSLCTQDAAFISLHWNADGSITREQRSPAEDRASAQKFFANHTGKVVETDTIDSITIAPDGLSARVLGHGTIRFLTNGKPEVLNAVTDQTVVLRDGHVFSLGQTNVSER